MTVATTISDDIEKFLQLPDWRKVVLKKKAKYVSYPIMTFEQQNARTASIFTIACHFGSVTIDELDESPFMVMQNLWPKAIEKFFTPRLLDLYSQDHILQMGFCIYCRNWQGHNLDILLLKNLSQIKIVPISGKCRIVVHAHGDNSPLAIINPAIKCIKWHPARFYEQLITYRIKKFLTDNPDYHYDDYLKDLKIPFWTYFLQNS